VRECCPSSYNCTISGTVVDCPGIAIEHLGLDGNSENRMSVNGIVNPTGQELSYVDDVSFSNIALTALSLLSNAGSSSQNGGNSQNSGPYSNLTMSNVGTCVMISADITIPFDTRGIHGLNCSTTASLGFAIYLNASNNSLEDISLTTTNTNADGILIGNLAASGAAQNNILFNISGGGFANVIHISPYNSNSTNQNNCPAKASHGGSPAYNVCDITIMAVTKSSGTASIKDEVGGAALTDSYVGMYILGEPVQSGSGSTTSNDTFLGNSHFTTSPNLPTWVVGANTPGSGCPTTGTGFSNVGSLYSATSSSSGTLWECESSGWVNVK
jgi:hypothetical protein